MGSRWHIQQRQYNPFGVDRRWYNLSPGTIVPLFRKGANGLLELVLARWGLIPVWWAKDKPPKLGFNAEIEEAAGTSMWRGPLSAARCLIPALGWYAWRTIERVDPVTRQASRVRRPYFIHRPDLQPFCFAGLMSSVGAQTTCAILTQRAAGPAAEVHARMPVVIPDDVTDAWLDSALTDERQALSLCQERAVEDFEYYAVSSRVNSVNNHGPELIAQFA
jgi:putative SOS response-associated peptidase YedK